MQTTYRARPHLRRALDDSIWDFGGPAKKACSLNPFLVPADALQALLGSEAQSFAPFRFAFHGTARRNLPSILAHGMSTEKRLSQRSGDWFAASPYVSLDYCRSRGGPLTRYQLVLFLLLPVPSAVKTRLSDIVVITDRHSELPLAIIEVELK